MSPVDRIEQLRELLTQYNHEYHVLAAPTVTDEEYDRLFRELRDLEQKHPEHHDPSSPTQRIGAPVVSFSKVKHARRMLSLDNAFTADEVLRGVQDERELVLEPKIDGLSLKLIYVDSKLVKAVTRGDGEHGDDVTVNARTIETIPLRLMGDPRNIEVTGEVYMQSTVFEELNAEAVEAGDEPFANARNAAAGTLKLKDPAEVAKRRLSFVAHGTPNQIEGIDTHDALIALFQELGFQTVYTIPVVRESDAVARVVTVRNPAQLEREIADADFRRKSLCVATDGLVFKINSLARQRELGEGTRAPKWAVAYKYPPERKATKLLDVTLQVGRTGRITPVAELEPVLLGGTTVRRASLCNQDEIVRLGINIGDSVLVEKSAEIIPKVMGLAKKALEGVYRIPLVCPCCKGPLEQPAGFVDLYCANPDCAEQVEARLIYATGKGALDIDGCGDVVAKLFVENGIRRLSDLFAASDFSFLKPAQRKKVSEGIAAAKSAPLWRKLNALCIEGWGKSTCQDVATQWPNLDAMIEALRPNEFGQSAMQRVLGRVKTASFVSYLEANAEEVERLVALGYKLEAETASAGPLTGKVFVITGSLQSGTRDQVIRRIEAAGGTVKSSVSAKVHYLIMGADAGATKANAAKKHGVEVIDEEKLYGLMGTSVPVAAGLDQSEEEEA
jgi:DNA ligase (NAD+)